MINPIFVKPPRSHWKSIVAVVVVLLAVLIAAITS